MNQNVCFIWHYKLIRNKKVHKNCIYVIFLIDSGLAITSYLNSTRDFVIQFNKFHELCKRMKYIYISSVTLLFNDIQSIVKFR